MTNQQSETAEASNNRRWTKKILVAVVVCALAIAVWGIAQAANQSPAGSDLGATGLESQQSSSTASASATAAASATPSSGKTAQPSTPAAAPQPATATAPPAPKATEQEPALSKDAALAAVPQPIATAVPLDQAVTVTPGVGVKVSNIAPVEGVAQGVGEIAGPSIQFTAVVVNNTGGDLASNSIAVMLEYGKDKIPAAQLSGPGVVAFPDVIANKQTATATFVFNVPLDQRQQVRILLSPNASSPIAAFEGAVSASKGTP